MDLNELKSQVRKSVWDTLKEYISEETTGHIVDTLIGLGIKKFSDLKSVRESDVEGFLMPIPLRILIESWRKIDEEIPQPTLQSSVGKKALFPLDWDDIYKADKKIKKRLENGKKLSKSLRKLVVKRVLSQVTTEKPHAKRTIFIDIVKIMKEKYKDSFKHELANGIVGKGTLAYFLQTAFDNKHRVKDKGATEAPKIKAAYGCKRWRLIALPENQTTESQEVIRQELVTTFQTIRPEAWPKEEIGDKMQLTYGTQRMEINTQAEEIDKARRKLILEKRQKNNKKRKDQEEGEEQNAEAVDNPSRNVATTFTTTSQLRSRWPFLFREEGILSHFKQLTSIDLNQEFETFVRDDMRKLMQYLSSSCEKLKKVETKMNKELEKNGPNPNSLRLACLIRMLTEKFDEDLDLICVVVDRALEEQQVEDTITLPKTPLLISAARNFYRKPKNIYFSTDGTVLGVVENFETGLKVLFAAYYCFNLEYAPKAQIVLEFIQRFIVKLNPEESNKRPSKAKTLESGGHYSSYNTHAKLKQLSRTYNDYLGALSDSSAQEESAESGDSD